MEEKIREIIRTVMKKNNWGLYFKGHPLEEMPVGGEDSMYRVNNVRTEELEGAVSEELKVMFEGTTSQGDTECQKKETKEGSNEM